MVKLSVSKEAFQQGAVVDWGVAARPVVGEEVSGDLHLVERVANGVLLAVVDGLGHGQEARAAAREAVGILRTHAHQSVIRLVQLCHEALARTRGVVLTLARVQPQENTVTWLGVGNVEGRLLHEQPGQSYATESVLLRGGLVGYQLPALHASVLPLARGDLMIFATDGVDANFEGRFYAANSPQRIADQILNQCFKGRDDGLVLVVRYLGLVS